MSDEGPPTEDFMPPPPKRRGRARLTVVTPGIPAAPEANGEYREAIAHWMRERIEAIEKAHQERVELLRTVGEHPSPVFQRIVRMDGALGMPKSLLAKKLGITPGTLMQHYGDDYDMGAAEVLSSIAANALRIANSATDPSAARVAMQILERRFGEEWKAPAQKLEVERKQEAPPIDASKMTFEERQQMRAMLQRIVNGGEGDPIQPEEEYPVIP